MATEKEVVPMKRYCPGCKKSYRREDAEYLHKHLYGICPKCNVQLTMPPSDNMARRPETEITLFAGNDKLTHNMDFSRFANLLRKDG